MQPRCERGKPCFGPLLRLAFLAGSGRMQLLLLLRPSCSAAVRHQARLDLVFVFLPLTASGAFAASYFEDAGRFAAFIRAYLSIHMGIALSFLPFGIFLRKTNCLHYAAHYLEDPRCSNLLCEGLSWLPLFVISPTLVTGSVQDIADTFVEVYANIMMYVPLFEEPLSLILRYAAYASLAWVRMLYLSSSEEVLSISLNPFLCQVALIVTVSAAVLRIRMQCLSLKLTQLTPDNLEEHTRMEPEKDASRQHRQMLKLPLALQADRADGTAVMREREVRRRRQLYKEELASRLLYPPWELFSMFICIKPRGHLNNVFVKFLRGV